jgi:hypothetical protein
MEKELAPAAGEESMEVISKAMFSLPKASLGSLLREPI